MAYRDKEHGGAAEDESSRVLAFRDSMMELGINIRRTTTRDITE